MKRNSPSTFGVVMAILIVGLPTFFLARRCLWHLIAQLPATQIRTASAVPDDVDGRGSTARGARRVPTLAPPSQAVDGFGDVRFEQEPRGQVICVRVEARSGPAERDRETNRAGAPEAEAIGRRRDY